MELQDDKHINYDRIAKAISFIQSNYKQQPSLDEIAEHIHMSPYHCQRLFNEWAGTTPKKFLQFISVAHAKNLLKASNTLAQTTFNVGLSSTSRLHELFVKLEGMTPSSYKNGGQNLTISYSFASTSFGRIIVAATDIGICHLAFYEDKATAIAVMQAQFPNATYIERETTQHTLVSDFFESKKQLSSPIKLHVKGTSFQLKVWEALLKIPLGALNTYGDVARYIGKANAARAVGTAIGSNPIAYLIPCHRVIQASGLFGGYMWGGLRKTAILGWENAHTYPHIHETL